MPDFAEPRKDPGAGIEVIEILAVDALDPQPVSRRSPRIAHADGHSMAIEPGLKPPRNQTPLNETARTLARANRPGRVRLKPDNARGAANLLLRRRRLLGRRRRAGGVAPAAGAAAPDCSPEAPAACEPAAPADSQQRRQPDRACAGAEAAGAGGVADVSVPAVSCFAQAVSISAATIALRASLVFIDRYPEGKQELCG